MARVRFISLARKAAEAPKFLVSELVAKFFLRIVGEFSEVLVNVFDSSLAEGRLTLLLLLGESFLQVEDSLLHRLKVVVEQNLGVEKTVQALLLQKTQIRLALQPH